MVYKIYVILNECTFFIRITVKINSHTMSSFIQSCNVQEHSIYRLSDVRVRADTLHLKLTSASTEGLVPLSRQIYFLLWNLFFFLCLLPAACAAFSAMIA